MDLGGHSRSTLNTTAYDSSLKQTAGPPRKEEKEEEEEGKVFTNCLGVAGLAKCRPPAIRARATVVVVVVKVVVVEVVV